MNSQTMVTFDYLESLTGADRAFMKAILVSMLDNMAEIIPQLRQTYRQQKQHEFSRLAHKLKSSLGYLHIETIDNLLNIMEGVKTKHDLKAPETKMALDNLELYRAILTKAIRTKIETLS